MPTDICCSLFLQTVEELKEMYVRYAVYHNYTSRNHTFYEYSFDAVWTAALAINRSLQTMPEGLSFENFTYDGDQLAKHLYRNLLELNFQGASVCLYHL